MKTAVTIMALILVAGCSGDGGKGNGSSVLNENASVNGGAPLANTSVGEANPAKQVSAMKIERKDSALDFDYEWPGEAVGIAPLNGWLKGHAEDQYKQAYAAAKEGEKLAKEGDYPFRQYSYAQSWTVVANSSAVLVLGGAGYSYTGGAHGMPFTASLIWDRKAEKRVAIKDVLDMEKFSAAATTAFCKELDAQRAKKRGEDAARMAKESLAEFSQCPDITEQEIIPVSDGGKVLDSIHIIIGPYVAGPYAEGNYEIALPLSKAMLGSVKPAYKGWFTADRAF
ncbi:MAG: DUF3298/DUF4163 domain-containing protein [Sphingobium sp.]|nr:DUF3298/DUF4163 domain-containing protein [Sphingobium sp.]